MPVTRRQFIKRSAAAVTVGLAMPSIWAKAARSQQVETNSSRRFVVIQLLGGNDGLNTVVPYTDSRYHALRPVLGLKESDLKTSQGVSTIISNEFGLHPAISDLKSLYDANKMAIVQGVGYQDSTLSHFLAMDIWHTADTSGLAKRGWLGKYADLALVGQPNLTASAIGAVEAPKSLQAEKVVIPTIINLDLYNFRGDPNYPGDYNNQLNTFNRSASRNLPADTFLGAINTAASESLASAQRLQQSVNTYTSSVRYPENNPLAVRMKLAAQVLVTIPEARLIYAQLGGFDNHSAQIARRNGQPDKLAGTHAQLLKWFSEAVKLFYDDMAEHNLADDTVIMQWSEFGRRPGENASFGTDHGTAGSMFIIGNAVRGGLYGEQPSLAASELDAGGNPKFKVDFREVYATILDKWLGVDSKSALGASYANMGFLG